MRTLVYGLMIGLVLMWVMVHAAGAQETLSCERRNSHEVLTELKDDGFTSYQLLQNEIPSAHHQINLYQFFRWSDRAVALVLIDGQNGCILKKVIPGKDT